MLDETLIFSNTETNKEDYASKINSLDTFELRKDKRKAYLNYLRGDYE